VDRFLKACLNGARAAGEHPGLPLTPAQLAADAVASAEAGAQAVHVHPRDEAGRETLDVGAAVAAIRAAAPGLPVGVSTGLWITGGNVQARRDAVREWTKYPQKAGFSGLPDFASVNLSEPGFAELAGDLEEIGVGVEAGVWSVADADALAASGLAGRCVRVLVEIIDRPPSLAAEIVDRLAGHGIADRLLLHGEGDAAWPVLAEAGRRGLPTRIGLEDTLRGPSGEPVSGNPELVRLARALLGSA
jgi:uncharacterized protein (DUF849 family)